MTAPVAEYKINTDEKLAVDLMVYWQPIATCPRNAKVQLLGKGGVPAYGTYSGSDPFWTMWCPLPRIPKATAPAKPPGAKRVAPWPDFAGNLIHEGDTIEHPSGERGVVVFLPERSEYGTDAWRVDYQDGNPVSRLGLQIGEKGQAVAVPRGFDERHLHSRLQVPGHSVLAQHLPAARH